MKHSFQDKFVVIILILSLVGLIDAIYLTYEHYADVIPVCGSFGDCGKVLSSKYSQVFGIPVSLLGAVNYLLIFAATMYSYLSLNDKYLKLIAIYTIFGFLASIGLVYLMAFVINEWCIYCLVSAATSSALFGTGTIYILKMKKESLPISKNNG